MEKMQFIYPGKRIVQIVSLICIAFVLFVFTLTLPDDLFLGEVLLVVLMPLPLIILLKTLTKGCRYDDEKLKVCRFVKAHTVYYKDIASYTRYVRSDYKVDDEVSDYFTLKDGTIVNFTLSVTRAEFGKLWDKVRAVNPEAKYLEKKIN